MITITKFISYTKYAIERHLGLVQSQSISQMIPLAVIPLSRAQCISNLISSFVGKKFFLRILITGCRCSITGLILNLLKIEIIIFSTK
jgi:hypothetical protein